jgi:tetratricopeptide (TPR) repeat protein
MLAIVHSYEGDFARAQAEARTAIDLAPYDAFMLATIAQIPIMSGHPDQALDWLAKAAARDPGNRDRLNYVSGWAHLMQGDYEKAITALKQGPNWIDMPILMAIAYVRLDRMDEAKTAVRRALEINPAFTQAKWREGYFYSDPSILERQLADLGKAGLPEK